MTSIFTLKRANLILPAAVATIAVTVLLPLLVHLFPAVGGVPMGARLLPLFVAPFVAVALFHPAVALIAALVTPLLNRALTGQPTLEMSALLTVELLAFAVFAVVLLQRWPRSWMVAPLAFVLAKVAALVVLSIAPLLPAAPWSYFTASLANAWPGLIVLIALNVVIVRVGARAERRR